MKLRPHFDDLEFLDPEECRMAREAVHAMRGHWDKIDWSIPATHEYPRLDGTAHRLGVSANGEAGHAPTVYIAKKNSLNPLLKLNFAWIYDRLAETLSRHFGAPAVYAPSTALPGFFIVLADRAWTQNRRDFHVDLHYLLLPKGFSKRGITQTLTLTCPISLPKAGAGLSYVDLHYNEAFGRSETEVRRMLLARKPRFHPYRLGKLTVHSGLFYHQLAAVPEFQDDEERITLQGHAVLRGGKWHIYW